MHSNNNKTISGVKWSTLSSVLVATVQFVTILFLSRVFSIKDLGIVAILQTIVGFTTIFLDVGISNAVVYKQNITQSQLSSVYWVNVFSGVFFTIIVFVLSPVISTFYNSEDLSSFIKLVSISFFILSVSRLYKFLFLKEVELKTIAISEISSYVFGLLLLLILVYQKVGIIAFVFSIVARSVVQSFILTAYGRKMFVPKCVYNHSSLKSLFRYGLFNLGQNLTVYATSQIDTVIIGKLLGLEALGIYNIAKNLAMKPLQLIAPVVSKITFPLMSKYQKDKIKFKNVYLLSIKHLFVVIIAIYIPMIFVGKDIILLLYGVKWEESILIFQLLCVLYIIVSIGNPIGSVILASGKVDWGFYWNLTMLFVVSFVIALSSQVSLKATTLSFLGYHVLAFIISFYLITRKIFPIQIKEIFMIIGKQILMMVIPIVFMYFSRNYINNSILKLFLFPVSTLIFYTSSIYAFDREYFENIKNNIK